MIDARHNWSCPGQLPPSEILRGWSVMGTAERSAFVTSLQVAARDYHNAGKANFGPVGGVLHPIFSNTLAWIEANPALVAAILAGGPNGCSVSNRTDAELSLVRIMYGAIQNAQSGLAPVVGVGNAAAATPLTPQDSAALAFHHAYTTAQAAAPSAPTSLSTGSPSVLGTQARGFLDDLKDIGRNILTGTLSGAVEGGRAAASGAAAGSSIGAFMAGPGGMLVLGGVIVVLLATRK